MRRKKAQNKSRAVRNAECGVPSAELVDFGRFTLLVAALSEPSHRRGEDDSVQQCPE